MGISEQEQLKQTYFYAQWGQFSAWVGGGIWLLLLLLSHSHMIELSLIQQIFLLAPLVIVPLGLPLTVLPSRQGKISKLYQLAQTLQPFCAALLLVSFWLPPSLQAGIFALPWLGLTFLLGLYGLSRHLSHGFTAAEEVAIDFSLMFLPVGGIWLVASRLGIPLMGFDGVIVLLTATHFHFAGFASPLLTGLSGRQLLQQRPHLRSLYRLLVSGVLAGIPLLALGITFSRLLEFSAAGVFAVSLSGIALLNLTLVLPRLTHRWSQLFLMISSLAVVGTLVLAATYAWSRLTGQVIITIPTMAQWHGAANALGFALCGLLAWRKIHPDPLIALPGLPFSQFSSQGHVGPDFFQRLNAVPILAKPPTGLIDDFTVYQRPDFVPDQLHPTLRHFYEHTADYTLFVTPYWQPGFRLGGRIYRRFANWMGQMCLPVESEKRQDKIDSQILPVDDRIDGRSQVRAWVRTYADTGNPVYVAAYAYHSVQEQTYMNIAFAVPGGNVSSILRLQALPTPQNTWQGLELTTWPQQEPHGDQGIYLANRWLPIRLPLNETITVWAAEMTGYPELRNAEMQDATLLATHDMWLWGIKFLTLHYYIFPNKCSSSANLAQE